MTRTAFEIDSNRHTSPTRPNALKHGLTARRYVSPEQSERVNFIREELLEIHGPETVEEMQIVDRLAVEMTRLYDADAAYAERRRSQKLHAEELFDRRHFERFQKDLDLWRTSSSLHLFDTFGKTWHAAAWLAGLWETVAGCLDHGVALSYEQTRDVILALGSDWRIDAIGIRQSRIMSLFLASTLEPETALAVWVADSRGDKAALAALADENRRFEACFDLTEGRPRKFLADKATVENTRAELKTTARERFEFWSAESQRLRSRYVEERAGVSESGFETGDAVQARESSRILRYAMTIQSRADRLERRLLALLKMRPIQRLRTPAQSLDKMFGNQTRTPSPIVPPPASVTHDPEPWPPYRKSKPTAPQPIAENASGPKADQVQTAEIKKVASISQNDVIETDLDDAEEVPQTRSERRPDPKTVAQTWRSRRKSGYRSKRRK